MMKVAEKYRRVCVGQRGGGFTMGTLIPPYMTHIFPVLWQI